MIGSAWRVPPNVEDAVSEQWPEAGPRWSANVIREFADLCERYELTPSQVFAARYAFAVAASTRSGEEVVLRSTPDPMAVHQAVVSQALADRDIGPRVHDVITTDSATWTIIDRVRPGDDLASLPNDQRTFRALTHVFQRLAGQPAPRADLPKLTDWLRQRLQDDHLTDLAPNRQPATPAERKHGLDALAQLEGCGSNDGLCHGDMSSTNVLLGSSGHLLLIDPRGLAGDANYDAAVLTAKATGYGISATVIGQLVKNAGFDRARTEAWASIAIAARV